MIEILIFSYVAIAVIALWLMIQGVMNDPSAVSVTVDGEEGTAVGNALGFIFIVFLAIAWPAALVVAMRGKE